MTEDVLSCFLLLILPEQRFVGLPPFSVGIGVALLTLRILVAAVKFELKTDVRCMPNALRITLLIATVNALVVVGQQHPCRIEHFAFDKHPRGKRVRDRGKREAREGLSVRFMRRDRRRLTADITQLSESSRRITCTRVTCGFAVLCAFLALVGGIPHSYGCPARSSGPSMSRQYQQRSSWLPTHCVLGQGSSCDGGSSGEDKFEDKSLSIAKSVR